MITTTQITDANRRRYEKRIGMRLSVHQGFMYVIEKDGEIVLIGGVVFAWQGLGNCYMHVFRRELLGPSVVREIKNIADYLQVRHQITRLQAEADTTKRANVRFLQSLGFDWLTAMPDYGPNGEDYVVMRRRVK